MTTIFKRALIQSGIFFCFILIAIPSTYAQDFEQTMVEAMCPCFERISHLESKSFEECLMSKLKPKLSLIIAHYKIDTTNNAFAVGQAFGQRVNRDIQLPLLKGCDAALRLAISQQKDGWNRLKSNSDSANYQLIMSELKTKGETREIVIALGYYYFAHEDFNKANFYANRYIELFQEYKEPYWLLAEVHLYQGDFTKAAEFYKGIYERTGEQQFKYLQTVAEELAKND